MRRSACTFFIVVILVSNGHAYAADYSVLTVAPVSTSWNTGLPTAVARGMRYFAEERLEVHQRADHVALLMSAQAQMVIAGVVALLRGIARGAPVVIIGGELSKMSYALMGANTFALSQFRSPAYNFNVDVVQWEELLFSGSKRAVVA